MIRLLLWLFVSLSAGSLVMYGLNPEGQARASSDQKFYAFIVGTLFLHGAGVVLISVFLRQHETNFRDGFGFSTPGVPVALVHGLIACVVVLPVALGLSVASSEVMRVLADTLQTKALAPVPQQTVQTIQETANPVHHIVFGVFAVVVAPLVEEMLFRGILYPAIKQNGWPRGAWIATSFFFALTHANAMTFVSLFVLSMVLIWLYERTGNLAAPILTHSLFNAANLFWLLQAQGAAAPTS